MITKYVYIHIYACVQVPGTKGTPEYAFMFSYLVPGAAIHQLSVGGGYYKYIKSNIQNHTQCTSEPLVPVHTLYSRTYIVRGTSWYLSEIPVPARTSPWQLEHKSPPSSTNSNRLWTRAEVSGGVNKGPSHTSTRPKSMVFRWRSRERQCTDK